MLPVLQIFIAAALHQIATWSLLIICTQELEIAKACCSWSGQDAWLPVIEEASAPWPLGRNLQVFIVVCSS